MWEVLAPVGCEFVSSMGSSTPWTVVQCSFCVYHLSLQNIALAHFAFSALFSAALEVIYYVLVANLVHSRRCSCLRWNTKKWYMTREHGKTLKLWKEYESVFLL